MLQAEPKNVKKPEAIKVSPQSNTKQQYCLEEYKHEKPKMTTQEVKRVGTASLQQGELRKNKPLGILESLKATKIFAGADAVTDLSMLKTSTDQGPASNANYIC